MAKTDIFINVHTNAPWSVTEALYGQNRTILMIRDSKNNTVASLPSYLNTHLNEKERIFSVADMLAAAPEMYAALSWLLEEVCKRDGEPFEGATDTARAALKLAGGI